MFKNIGIIFILVGIIIIYKPEFIAYILGALLIVMGLNIFITGMYLDKKAKGKEKYIKFGKYKIYR